jgi:ATP-binding cassette subfamily B protein RaxB
MDEGTAHLDIKHEKLVNTAIKEMGITRLIIAHREETINAADRIVIMANGVIDDTYRGKAEKAGD